MGHAVGKDGIHVNPSLVQDEEIWPVPQILKERQALLRLTIYYRRFVKEFADIARPLHNLTRNGAAFIWKIKQASNFIALLIPSPKIG